MLSHASIWKAIDALARHNNISPSGLARKAGLDPTTFNPSKRFKANGKPRWPSTESIAKILEVTNASAGQFFSSGFPFEANNGETRSPFSFHIEGNGDLSPLDPSPPHKEEDMLPVPSGTIPLWLEEPTPDMSATSEPSASDPLKSTKAPSPSLPSLSSPSQHLEDFIAFPAPVGEPVFALAVCNDALEPLYHCGDTLLVSPTSSMRTGDRILTKSRSDILQVYSLIRATSRSLIVHAKDSSQPEKIIARKDLLWTARILWASQ